MHLQTPATWRTQGNVTPRPKRSVFLFLFKGTLIRWRRDISTLVCPTPLPSLALCLSANKLTCIYYTGSRTIFVFTYNVEEIYAREKKLAEKIDVKLIHAHSLPSSIFCYHLLTYNVQLISDREDTRVAQDSKMLDTPLFRRRFTDPFKGWSSCRGLSTKSIEWSLRSQVDFETTYTCTRLGA